MKAIILLSCIFFFGCSRYDPKIDNAASNNEATMEEKIQANISEAQKAKEEYKILRKKRDQG